MKNYYAVLKLPPAASMDRIRARYRELTRAMHPDAGGDTDAFVEITEAGSVLCDFQNRDDYDRRLSILMDPCPECRGQGVVHVQLSFHETEVKPCTVCNQEGYHGRS